MSSDVTSIYSQDKINSPNSRNGAIYEFEDFRLDAARLMLYKNEKPLALAPKVVETLVALVERRGEVVSKNELMERVWADSFVEESNLTQNIYLLRKAVGKTAKGEPLIESFRRRGYRFNGEIKSREKTETPAEIEKSDFAAEEKVVQPPTDYKRRRGYFLAGAIAACGLLILLGFSAARFFSTKSEKAQIIGAAPPNLKIARLTPDLNVFISEFTPDGKSLIYTLREKGKQSVWLKDLATGEARQILPPSDTPYGTPRFSRDGAMIYYLTNRPHKPNSTLVRISATGGAASEPEEIVTNTISPIAFSPDEKQIVFLSDGNYYQLRIANTDGTNERVLAQRDLKKGWFESWESRMSWSPDGEKIAICGARYEGGKRISELIEVNVRDGGEKTIPTPPWNYLDDVEWLGDGTGLIVVARETETSPFQIWHVSYPTGATRRITNDSNDYVDIALSPDSRQLATNQKFYNTNLWIAPFDDLSQAGQITFGSRAADGFDGIAFTPGGKIIYTSPRDGNVDLWMMNADGGEQKQLTKNAGGWNARPQVTADGRYIVFVSTRTGAKQIWRMDADGGNPVQMTDVLEANDPSPSPDNNWIYFSNREDEKSFIAKIPSSGGEPARVSKTPHSADTPNVSPDGRLIFYNIYEAGSAQPWKSALMSAETGLQIKMFEHNYRVAWMADSKSVIRNDGGNLFQMPLDAGEQKQLTNFTGESIRWFAVSPDYRKIVMSRGNPSREAVLIENFGK